MPRIPLFSFLAILLLVTRPATAANPWHLPGWQARAIVEIPKPATDADVDTAAVKVLCQGRARADGSDYRVLDAAGKAVPFQITFHDAGRYSLLSFRAADAKQRYFVYFGNPKAERSPEEIVIDPKPGAGPPKAAWVPRFGLVYQTIRRPKGDNPKTVADMAKLIADSPGKDGARYQRRIADGYNPFGSSDYYISIYRGWMRIPKDGKYQFCTASNEASFSFMDGKELVHWPGRHTAARGMHGEVNAMIELTAGLHYVEYYHEEVTLEQMAFLGWRPSADLGAFGGIPETVYTAPHDGVVTRYEDARGQLVTFEPVITDSVWPLDRSEGQYTRVHFQVGKAPPLPEGSTVTWDFGDGQTATGLDVDHVYLVLGNYAVTLNVLGPPTATVRWPLEIYEIEHVTEQFKEGRPKDYAKLAKAYDRNKLDATNLKELAHLLAESEEPAEAVEVGKGFVQRFEKEKPEMLPKVRRLMADCALRLGKAGVEEAIASYQASIGKDTPLAERFDILARLIRLLGMERDLIEKAGTVVVQVEDEAFKAIESKTALTDKGKDAWRRAIKGATDDETLTAYESIVRGALEPEILSAYRRAVIAGGDVLLWHAKRDGALALYRRAERLNLTKIPANVKAARVGAYPNSIREFIDSGNIGAAVDVVDKWEETFPSDKIEGQTFFWRGKLLALRGQPGDAARYLPRGVGLGSGGRFETEARWLLAEALEQLDRKDDAKKELAKLIATGLNDEFTKKAREKLKK
jgi:tetratricopeptide (TPR) repeat protein